MSGATVQSRTSPHSQAPIAAPFYPTIPGPHLRYLRNRWQTKIPLTIYYPIIHHIYTKSLHPIIHHIYTKCLHTITHHIYTKSLHNITHHIYTKCLQLLLRNRSLNQIPILYINTHTLHLIHHFSPIFFFFGSSRGENI